MNMDMSTKHTTWLSAIALAILSLVVLPFGCSGSTGDSASDSTAVSQSTDDDHGHEHGDDDDHGHEHGDEEGHDDGDDHGHEHADDDDHGHEHGDDESPDTVDGLLHSIHNTHLTIETADTDEKLMDVHHAPFQIHDYLTKLQPMLELSGDDAAEYAKLLERIGQQADLIEKHTHDEEPEMVKAIVEKLNANIEAAEKIAAPDHEH